MAEKATIQGNVVEKDARLHPGGRKVWGTDEEGGKGWRSDEDVVGGASSMLETRAYAQRLQREWNPADTQNILATRIFGA